MKVKLVLNPHSGTYHAHRSCRTLQGRIQRDLVETERKASELPFLRLCGYCARKLG